MTINPPKITRFGNKNRNRIIIATSRKADSRVYWHPNTRIASIGRETANQLRQYIQSTPWSKKLFVASCTYQNIYQYRPQLVESNQADELIFWQMGAGQTGRLTIVGTTQSSTLIPQQIESLKWITTNKAAENRLMKFVASYQQSDKSAAQFSQDTGVQVSKTVLSKLIKYQQSLACP